MNAIEAAARAAWKLQEPDIYWSDLEPIDRDHLMSLQRAAIIAFLHACEVSEGMGEAYLRLCSDVHFPEPPPPSEAWDILRNSLAAELEGK
jgi:hypothetical protein